MPYSTVVSGTVITASWANANVRDQVVTPFATAAARASAITAPVAGMLSYRTDVKTFEGYDGGWRSLPFQDTRYLSADQTITNSTTLVDGLSWPMDINSNYKLEAHLLYSAGTVPDFKLGWAGPAGFVMRWGAVGVDVTLGSVITGMYAEVDTPGFGGNNSQMWIHVNAFVGTTATLGNLVQRFAQNTADATATTLHGRSFGTLTRIG